MNEVKTPKRPLIFYYCVAVLILLLFNFLAMPWLAQRQIQLQEQENRLLFTDEKGSVVYKTALVGDPDLTERVLDAGASLTGDIWNLPEN